MIAPLFKVHDTFNKKYIINPLICLAKIKLKKILINAIGLAIAKKLASAPSVVQNVIVTVLFAENAPTEKQYKLRVIIRCELNIITKIV